MGNNESAYQGDNLKGGADRTLRLLYSSNAFW